MSRDREVKLDKRTVEIYLREGELLKDDLEKALNSLPNREKQAEFVEITEMAPAAYLRGVLGMEKFPKTKTEGDKK